MDVRIVQLAFVRACKVILQQARRSVHFKGRSIGATRSLVDPSGVMAIITIVAVIAIAVTICLKKVISLTTHTGQITYLLPTEFLLDCFHGLCIKKC